METQLKNKIISEAYIEFADKINSLNYIKENDNSFGPTGDDGLSIFRPHNISKAVDEIFHIVDVDYIDDNYREKLKSYEYALSPDVLFGFKYRADEHIGYVLKTFSCIEPVMLMSGRPSKSKTEEKNYAVIASYNFYSGNIDVNVIESRTVTLMALAKTDSPEQFYKDYQEYCDILEVKRRDKKMIITTGMWEDMQNQIRKLSERIDELKNNLSENYERRYNSMEE